MYTLPIFFVYTSPAPSGKMVCPSYGSNGTLSVDRRVVYIVDRDIGHRDGGGQEVEIDESEYLLAVCSSRHSWCSLVLFVLVGSVVVWWVRCVRAEEWH